MPVPIHYSNHAELAALDVTADGKPLELLPLFAPGITEYTLETDAEEIELHAAAAHTRAKVELLGDGISKASNVVTLKLGDNVLTAKVQAEDGTVRTYTLTIHRAVKDEDTPPPSPLCSFIDIANHWAKSAICEAADLGIAEGVSSKRFVPDGFVTRTEFAVMLQRTLRIAIRGEEDSLPYSDSDSVPEWARPAIRTAVTEGILEGYPDNTLRPARTVTRVEMAAMISRAMSWDAIPTRGSDFGDHDNIPLWAKAYVEAARVHGIITGREGNQFVPDGLTTRAEAAVAMLRLWKLLD